MPAAAATSPAPAPATRPRVRVSRTTLLLACSALLALSSFAIAGKTGNHGGGLGHVLAHGHGHDKAHHVLRQSAVDIAGAIRRGDGNDDNDNSDTGAAASASPSSSSVTTTTTTTTTTAPCIPDGSPNPISNSHPGDISGNLNGTTMIVPIPLAQARAAVPSAYGLLEHQWRQWLPGFPEGMYPMMAVGVYDHDLRFPAYNVTTPDFSRAALEFPFIDVLNDGHSAFRWAANMLITAGSPAVAGSEAYGINVWGATFDPPCRAYEHSAASNEPGLATFRAWEIAASPSGSDSTSTPAKSAKCSTGPGNHDDDKGDDNNEPWKNAARSLSFETRPILPSISPPSLSSVETGPEFPYPLTFLVNITNQPVFAEPSICDNYKRLFNTTLTTDPANAPVQVVGTVAGNLEPFGPGSGPDGEGSDNERGQQQQKQYVWPGVFGWRIATAFLEPPVPGPCAALKGYTGTGSGDSAMPL